MKQLVTNFLLCVLVLVFSYFLLSSFLPTEAMGMNNHSAPVVITNTMIDISKNGMEKRSYISDTCGNFSKSTYDMTIHSSPFSIFGATSGVTIDSCLPYQVFVPDSSGGRFGQCQNQCAGNQYFDITNQSCMKCPIGYINDGNNHCVPLETCPRGFKYTDHSGNCNTCPSGKKFDNGINCIDICLEPYKKLTADGNCKMKCPSRSEIWDPNANDQKGGCLPCSIGMVNNGRNKCIALPSCPEGMHFNSDSKCISKCQDYERYNPLANQCQKICSPTQKFDKNTGLCFECPSGFQSNVDDAYSCKEIPVQQKTCEPGYNLNSKNVCISICLDHKKNNPLEPTMCVPKCPPNSIYMPDTSCKYCEYGNSVNNVCPGPPQTPPVANAKHEIINGVSYEKCPTWKTRTRSNPSICTPFCTGNTIYNVDGTCKQCGAGYVSNIDTNICQRKCPAWQILSITNDNECVHRCLDRNNRWDSDTSKCVPCSNDSVRVDSNNVCVLNPTIKVANIILGSRSNTTMIGEFFEATNTTKVNITIQQKSGNTYTDGSNYDVTPKNGSGGYTFTGLSPGNIYRMRFIPYNGDLKGIDFMSQNLSSPVTTSPVTSIVWNFSFNSPPESISVSFSNIVTRDANGLVTITPPTGGWTVKLMNQSWPGGFSNQIGDQSNLFHVNKAEKGGGYYTPKQNILIPVTVVENKTYTAYMHMNTNGTLYGLFLPQTDLSKHASTYDIVDPNNLQNLRNASRAYIYDKSITSTTVWYFATGGSGTSYNITPFSDGKIQYNVDGTTGGTTGGTTSGTTSGTTGATLPKCADGYKFYQSSCYSETCPLGYIHDGKMTCNRDDKRLDTGTVLHSVCPDGYTNSGTSCYKTYPTINKDSIRNSPCDGLENAKYYDSTCTGWNSCKIKSFLGCIGGFETHNIDRKCQNDNGRNFVLRGTKCWSDTYTETKNIEWTCRDGKENHNSLCYNKCPNGYKYNNYNSPTLCIPNGDKGSTITPERKNPYTA